MRVKIARSCVCVGRFVAAAKVAGCEICHLFFLNVLGRIKVKFDLVARFIERVLFCMTDMNYVGSICYLSVHS